MTPTCPACGEPVEETWKLCPVCAAPLAAPVCPQCAAAVKAHWKLCPACGARLLCAGCGRRMPPGGGPCPACDAERAGADRLIEPLSGMTLVRVPGGEFEMGDLFGDGWEDETPVHRVRVTGFHMGRHPVTQAEWQRVMGENPSRFQRGGDHPVEQVSFAAVAEFIRRLNAAARPGERYRLPTEAEWEYAARSGGRRERYAGGDEPEALAWYDANSGGSTRPVGRKRPNGLGLCDMSGNVWEWCRDVYAAGAYRDHGPVDPVAAGRGGDRVIRGGSWNLDAWSVRASRRAAMPEEFYGPGLGFRLVRTP
jgi:formylglycine-generating enzyme required for sulfatase activity